MVDGRRLRIVYYGSVAVAALAVLVVALKSSVAGLVVGALVVLAEAAVYVVFFRPMLRAGRIAQTGRPAEAEILEVSDTATTVNMNPLVKLKLKVLPDGGEPYETQTKTVISRLKVHEFQPGLRLSVLVDPEDPLLVAVAPLEERAGSRAAAGATAPASPEPAENTSPAAAAVAAAGRGGSDPAADEGVRQARAMLESLDRVNGAILACGKPARALVLDSNPLGVDVNGPNPATWLLLEVRPADRPSFRAQATCVIAGDSIPRYRPGRTINVRYDPGDLTRVAVEHS